MLIRGDARSLPLIDGCVDCIVTSPPYFGLRDYGTARWEGGDPACDHKKPGANKVFGNPEFNANRPSRVATDTVGWRDVCGLCGAVRVDAQIGLEPTPDAYVASLVQVFRELRRVLKDTGTVWLNLGDSYNSNASNQQDGAIDSAYKAEAFRTQGRRNKAVVDLKAKDLMGIPWRVAFALQNDGWVLRQEIIWEKPNPMPESVQDRCTKAHEHIFMFAKARWSGPKPGRFAHISDADARWLALLVDAEGSVVVKRGRHEERADTFAPQVSVSSTSLELMERVVEIVGHGTLAQRPGKNAPMWCWQVAHNIAAHFLRRIYPFLIIKHRQARIGIHVDTLTYYRGGQKPERKQRTEALTRALERLWERGKACNQFQQPDLSDVPEPQAGRWVDCERYFYDADAIKEAVSDAMLQQVEQGYEGLGLKDYEASGVQNPSSVKARIIAGARPRFSQRRAAGMGVEPSGNEGRAQDEQDFRKPTRNKRTVWTVPTMPYSGAHFATMPEALVEPCILAGCPLGGLVLDPFIGSGTVGAVAERLGRRWVGTDLSYQPLARKRTAQRGIRFEPEEVA